MALINSMYMRNFRTLLRSALFLTVFGSISTHVSARDPVIPDGSTNTSVSIQDGKTIVSIAPSDADRVSVNNYTMFNVPESGVALDNTEEAARTIINDITGNESSFINGRLEVLGTRAHVIIANRNGITVNGGRFINNADLILTTGTVGRVERNISEGVVQNNVTLSTKGGEIVIGEDGLSGAINTLDLISHSIKVDGVVSNTNDGLRNVVRVFPGHSESELDVSLSPSNPVRAMASVKQENVSGTDNAVLFEITQQGSISSGSISIAVTQNGAGFRHAGSLNALSGDVAIDVNGLMDIAGGDIAALRHVKLKAQNIDISHKEKSGVVSQSVIQAKAGAVIIEADERVTNKGAVIRGFERDAEDERSKGAVTIKANDVINSSQDLNALAVLFGEDDDLVIEASNILENNTGRLVSNKKIILDVGYLNNHIDVEDFEGQGEWNVSRHSGKRLWYSFFLKKEKVKEKYINFGMDRLEGQLAYISGEEGITVNAEEVINSGGEINANNGDITITTKILKNEAIRIGELDIVTKCGFRCSSYGDSSINVLGGNINAGNEVNIDATGSVQNLGGQILAINDLNIKSPQVKTSSFEVYNVVSRDRGLSGLNIDKAFIYSRDQGGSFI